KLLEKFDEQMKANFFKKDAFLNNLFRVELPQLRKELFGLKQSNEAKRYISGELKRKGTKTINVVVDKDISALFDQIVEESNLHRDAVINRMMLLLLAPDSLLNRMTIPSDQETEVKNENGEYEIELSRLPSAPLKCISCVLDDPFYYLRGHASQKGIG